jgi:hypothetical protein
VSFCCCFLLAFWSYLMHNWHVVICCTWYFCHQIGYMLYMIFLSPDWLYVRFQLLPSQWKKWVGKQVLLRISDIRNRFRCVCFLQFDCGTWQKYAGNIGWLFKITRLLELRFWPTRNRSQPSQGNYFALYSVFSCCRVNEKNG